MSEWIYVALHRLLFVVHAAFAAYVAGGSLWLTLRGARGLVSPVDDEDAIARTLRDWLPFVLGLAITFGVGPLLFVQLLDGGAFYTANLLLSHRFMAILPALIAGFYLLYVQKSAWRPVRSRLGRFVVPLLAFGCFGFTAWSWSENHLLAQDAAAWPQVYAAGAGFHGHADLPFRLLVFAGIALQSVACLVAAQGRELRADPRSVRRLAALAIVGVAAVFAGLALHPAVPGVSLLTPTGGVIAVAGIAVVGVWIAGARVGPAPLVPALLALVVLVERLGALREVVRLARDGAERIAENASSQGFAVFLASLVAVAVAICWSVARVRRDLAAD